MKACRIALVALIALAGCSKLHEKKEFSLDTGGYKTLEITAPLSEQKIKVALTADQPVSIYVLLEKDMPKAKGDELDPDSIKTGIIASQKGAKEATLDATIPAKEKYVVLVFGASKKTNVTVKIDSQ